MVEADPEVGWLPVQAPLAVQVVALVDDQARVLELPLATVVGLALMLTVGVAAGAVTDTVADFAVVPPAPVQLSVYVLLALRAPVEADPDVALVPDHAPVAVQLLALVDDQVRVLDPPLATLAGLAPRVTVGVADPVTATVTVFVAVRCRPVPVQLREKLLVLVSGPVVYDPEAPFAPDHAPLALHAYAHVDPQVIVLWEPDVTLDGLAPSVTVGVHAAACDEGDIAHRAITRAAASGQRVRRQAQTVAAAAIPVAVVSVMSGILGWRGTRRPATGGAANPVPMHVVQRRRRA